MYGLIRRVQVLYHPSQSNKTLTDRLPSDKKDVVPAKYITHEENTLPGEIITLELYHRNPEGPLAVVSRFLGERKDSKARTSNAQVRDQLSVLPTALACRFSDHEGQRKSKKSSQVQLWQSVVDSFSL